MKGKNKLSERGQVLILLVFGLIALIGLTGLAIDGGNAFADRRRAQNASDSAALAAALAATRGANPYTAAVTWAANNGYTNDGIQSTVIVNRPPAVGCKGQTSPYAGNTEYIQVIIHSNIDTSLARLISINQIHNCTEAVARARPAQQGEMFFGNALVSLKPGGCRTTFVHGTARNELIGGGLFVNSDHPTCAFEQNGNGSIYAPNITIVGGAEIQKIDKISPFPPQTGSSQIPYPPPFLPPEPTCSNNAQKTGNRLSPGNVGDFPPAGVTELEPGIYCVNGDFMMNAHDTIHGESVLIFIKNGSVHFNGNAQINLSAPTSGPYAGLLIYQAINNTNRVTLNGNSDTVFVGTILAPGAEIQINGTQNSNSYQSQIIGYTLDLIGTSDAVIRYSNSQNYDAYMPPEIELAQ